MSRHDPQLSLRQMGDHGREVVALVRQRNRGDPIPSVDKINQREDWKCFDRRRDADQHSGESLESALKQNEGAEHKREQGQQ